MHGSHYTGNMPCDRLYLTDTYLFTFEATVTDIREYARRDGQQIWQVALDRTAFYPAAGGQPYDIGTLVARSRSGSELEITVDDVMEDDAGEIWHSTTKPVLAGTTVTGQVDRERRLDHAQQHTGQHLLSAVLASKFNAPTVSFHLGEQDTTIDLAVGTPEAQAALIAQLPEVERQVNACITANLPVSTRTVSNEEAQSLLAAGLLRKLPPREGEIRLIEIPGLDLNACGGTHVRALGQIGAVMLRETERVKKTLRLYFRCGARAVAGARQDFTTLAETSQALSIAPHTLPATITRLQTELRLLTKDRARLREELADNHAVQLAVEEHIVNGLRLVRRRFADRDAEYVKLVASRLMSAVPHTAAVLVSTMEEPATLVVASNKDLQPGCGVMLREILGPHELRGGGTAEIAQAQVPAWLLPTITDALVTAIEAAHKLQAE